MGSRIYTKRYTIKSIEKDEEKYPIGNSNIVLPKGTNTVYIVISEIDHIMVLRPQKMDELGEVSDHLNIKDITVNIKNKKVLEELLASLR